MKNFFTFLVAALAVSAGANAQVEELSFNENQWAWSQKTQLLDVVFTANQWGGLIVTNNVVEADDYSGIKIEYSDLKRVDDAGFQLCLGSVEEGKENVDAYPQFMEAGKTEGTCIIPIPEKYAGRKLTTILIQAQATGVQIKVKGVWLVKKDNTEEALPESGMNGSGISTGSVAYAVLPCTIAFASAYNGPNICDKNGQRITREKNAGDEYEYTIEFAEPIGDKFQIMAQGLIDGEEPGQWGDATKIYMPIAAGSTSFKFTLNDDKTKDDSGNAFNISSMKFVTIAGDAGTSKPEVKFASMKREKKSTTGITTVAAADAQNAPVYNLAGQRVNGNAKGILVKNGKKFIVK